MSISGSRPRFPALDGLRALGALFVVSNHAFRFAWPSTAVDSVPRGPVDWTLVGTGWMQYGHFAVIMFIALSGFCLMLPVACNGGTMRDGVLTFYRKRMLRILPTYYGAMLVSLLLIATVLGHKTGTQWDTNIPVTSQGIMSCIFMCQDCWAKGQINSPFWSIAVESRIYIWFPLLVWSFRQITPWVTTALAIILIPWPQNTFPIRWIILPDYLRIFALGMLGASLAAASTPRLVLIRRRTPWFGLALLTFSAVGYKLATHNELYYHDRLPFLDLVVAIGCVGLFISLSDGDHPITRALAWNPLVFLGGMSYSLYLIHFPFQAILWIYLIRPLGLTPEFGLVLLLIPGTALVALGAWLFHSVFERPIIEWMAGTKKAAVFVVAHRADTVAITS